MFSNTLDQDMYLLDLKNYTDYVDHFMSSKDFFYLPGLEYCRAIVKQGYKLSTRLYSEEEFLLRKAQVTAYQYPNKYAQTVFKDFVTCYDPVLDQLAKREIPNYNKLVTTILFTRYVNKDGFEETGYIDYEHSLRRGSMKHWNGLDWMAIFQKRKRIRPRSCDLSYFNWRTRSLHYNESDNFQLVHDDVYGLSFKCKHDLRLISANWDAGEDSQRTRRARFFSPFYGYVVFIDHLVKR